ncbi:oligosaccharide flippase family protein [uncultured Tateyamaria sp.]|uniref:lipopolysaccharide biosynthesis protein n=1 Tax=uncultured Tateyamaria sp. TaxID=455651 RepID=UPI00260B7EDA|nr:oligosaccharide flippase family protein [uncultured Tateyamaria sp.]
MYKRIIRNAGWLFSTQVLGGLVGVVTLAMMARTVGPAGLGVIAIVQAYTRIVDRLIRLEPWQTIIKYGMEALEAGDTERFKRLLKASIVIDMAGALVAGSVAVGLASIATPLLNLSEEHTRYVQLLSLGLFFTLQPTGIAILRVLDRFDLLAKIDFGTVMVRFALTALAFWFGLGIWAFIVILLVERTLNGSVGFAFGLRELRRRGYTQILTPPLYGVLGENPGFLRLLWNSNINVILRQSTQRFDIIILSAFADTSAVGAYFLARRLSEATLRLTRPLSQVVYPELVRIWSSGTAQAFRKLVLTATLVLGGLSTVFYVPAAFYMGDLLALFFGEGFRDAALLVSVQLLAVAIYLSGTMANPAMLTIGRDRELVRITLISTVMFFVLIVPLILWLGPVGLSLNHLLFNVLWLGGCGVVIRDTVRARKRTEKRTAAIQAEVRP